MKLEKSKPYRCYQCKKNFSNFISLHLHWHTKNHKKAVIRYDKNLKDPHFPMIKESNKNVS